MGQVGKAAAIPFLSGRKKFGGVATLKKPRWGLPIEGVTKVKAEKGKVLRKDQRGVVPL